MESNYDIDKDITTLYNDKRLADALVGTGLAAQLGVIFNDHIKAYERELIGLACDVSWWSGLKNYKKKFYIKALLDVTHSLLKIVETKVSSREQLNHEIQLKETAREKARTRTPFYRGTPKV